MSTPPKRLAYAERLGLAEDARRYQAAIADAEQLLARGDFDDFAEATAEAVRATNVFAGSVVALIRDVVDDRYEGAELRP